MSEPCEGPAIEGAKALARRYLLDILNRRRLEELADVAAVDYLDHAAFPGQPPGLAGLRFRIELLLRALDARWTILDLAAEPAAVVVRWALRGVHRDEFLGLAPTGRPVSLSGIDIFRVREGKLAEHWNVVDLSPLLGSRRSAPA